jgi:hypothetical protein
MKELMEAVTILLFVVLTFAITIIFAKKNKKSSRK